MRRIAVLSLFLCLVAVCRAQYIGSQYMNVKLGYIVDESQVQGTFGFGKVYKAFKVLSLIHISMQSKITERISIFMRSPSR